jgi:AraC family transcriptional regulator of adaptative response / DNA-3-methyladenine glycosylase II
MTGLHFLAFHPPLEWRALLSYLGARAIPGVEAVTTDQGGRYWRTVRLSGRRGWIVAGRARRGHTLEVEVSAGLTPVINPLTTRLRRLFDLDAFPELIATHLSADATLAPLVAARPGLRKAGTVDGFELAVRAVLGQQVSVRGASTLAGRVARLLGEPLSDAPTALTFLPVTAERMADASTRMLMDAGLTRARAECLVALGRATAEGALPELSGADSIDDPTGFMERFMSLPGIGAWTAEYVAMRALGCPDAFPDSDLGLRKATGETAPARLREMAERWRPWRSYAAQHLWASLGGPVH